MFNTTYRLSVISTPTFENREPGGPIRNGTTYIVLPAIDPRKQRRQLRPRLVGRHPVVGRPDGVGVGGADEREVLGAGDVVGGAPMEHAPGQCLLVERDELPGGEAFSGDSVALGLGPIAKHDAVGCGQRADLVDPLVDEGITSRHEYDDSRALS